MQNNVLKLQTDLYSFINRYYLAKMIWDNQASVVPSLCHLIAKFMM